MPPDHVLVFGGKEASQTDMGGSVDRPGGWEPRTVGLTVYNTSRRDNPLEREIKSVIA